MFLYQSESCVAGGKERAGEGQGTVETIERDKGRARTPQVLTRYCQSTKSSDPSFTGSFGARQILLSLRASEMLRPKSHFIISCLILLSYLFR